MKSWALLFVYPQSPVEVACSNKAKVMAYDILPNKWLIMVTAEGNTIPSVEANN